MRYVLVLCCLLWCAVPASARDIAGVQVAETHQGADGVALTLNGAGIRSKMFFKIYVAGLYLENPATEATAVLADTGHKQMIMHFLYNEVGREKLVDAWNEGFAGNLSREQRASLAPRIEQFNAMFATVTKGDTIVLEYIPERGTSVTIAGEVRGAVEGKDFCDALFSIWLGEKPVTKDLKNDLLGYNR